MEYLNIWLPNKMCRFATQHIVCFITERCRSTSCILRNVQLYDYNHAADGEEAFEELNDHSSSGLRLESTESTVQKGAKAVLLSSSFAQFAAIRAVGIVIVVRWTLEWSW